MPAIEVPVEVTDEDERPLERTDIAHIPDDFRSSDAPSQMDILQGLLDQVTVVSAEGTAEFHRAPIKDVPVSRFRRDFQEGRENAAMRRLMSRNRVVFEKDDLVDHDDAKLAWGQDTHYLDFIMAVPRNPGFAAIMPTRQRDHNWVWEASFQQRHRRWSVKYGKLGFDPTGRMLLLGKANGQNVWCAMVPKEFFDDETCFEKYTDDPRDADLLMPVGRYRRLMMFWALLFSSAQIKDIDITNEYPPTIDGQGQDVWGATTSLL
jgi:hypothetical protein